MKCFKLFFKHTWQPQQMDNPVHLNGSRSSRVDLSATELGEVRMASPTPAASSSKNVAPGPCSNGPCKTSMSLHNKPESPWHSLKTVFLVSFIIALIIWIIVYTLLSQYELL
uniref:DNER protein n=1 Tax=Fopius arisanus TaxID=64838 RepID=A0A0C9QNK6_9HYME